MKQVRIFLPMAVLVLGVAALAQVTQSAAAAGGPEAQESQTPPTIASTVDSQISAIEKLVVEAAKAMPEDKFNFSPEGLNIPGSDYKSVRTFALQVKHVAASNYALWTPLTGDEVPEDWKGGNGPEALKTKAQIITFLEDSFALGHKAAATLTAQNMLETTAPASRPACTEPRSPSSTRLITTGRWRNTCG